ncbi:hypothetical protein CPC16_009695 [Podila verticillata]|nr:hypothetical protein BGZ59_002635 [Podila verticillata]KAF9394980.1 hypothetical protein CPC16_009695 [Podila verticillata]KFH63512.1 hypothetical protein MVEG_10921 [Podila verticillata NRRL 6337]
MSAIPFLITVLRKAQTIRIIVILIIFFLLASVSRYQGSFEFSIGEDGEVQSAVPPESEHDVYYSHHIASFNRDDLKPWTKGDTAALRTTEGQKAAQALTSSPFVSSTTTTLRDNYFLDLTKRLRVFRSLWMALKEYYDQLEQKQQQELFFTAPPTELATAVELLQKMEQQNFPWVHKHHNTTYDLYRESRNGGRGIVMCVGNYHTKYARTVIKTLRDVLKSSLPIEIYYTGEPDLSPENRAWFEKFDDVKTIDITTLIDNNLLVLEGWAVKPFAMLVSRFSEIILMDSDAYFLQDPAVMFEDEGYKETGTVYFYDRTLFPGTGGDKKQWLESFLPTMSNHPAKTRWFRLKGDHEQESGVVVFDKRRLFLGLLAICKLNDLHERQQVTYKKTWGDKETFWIALEMIQEPYSFVKYGGGAIGNVGDAIPYNKESLPPSEIERYNKGEHLTTTNPVNLKDSTIRHNVAPKLDRVCGNQLHFDFRGQPLWWNSGVVRDKFTTGSPYLLYTAYMKDEDGDWDFESSCLVQKHSTSIMEVEWAQRKVALEILKADRDVAVEIDRSYIKEILDIPAFLQSQGAKGGHGNNEAI